MGNSGHTGMAKMCPGRGTKEEARPEKGPLTAQIIMEHVYGLGSGLGIKGLEYQAKELGPYRRLWRALGIWRKGE